MYRFELKSEYKPSGISMFQMQVGQIAEIIDTSYQGDIVLRTYDRIQSLNNPSRSWDNPTTASVRVKLLPKGSKITLTVED